MQRFAPRGPEGILRLPTAWSEPSAQSRSRADDRHESACGRQLSDSDTGDADYAAIDVTHAHTRNRWARSPEGAPCNLALTLLVISGRQIVDRLPGCERRAWLEGAGSARC